MIKLNDLAIGYNGEAILEHIDQEFDDGLIYGILAKSGAERHGLNRSTLLGRIRRGVPDSELFAPPKKTHLATK